MNASFGSETAPPPGAMTPQELRQVLQLQRRPRLAPGPLARYEYPDPVGLAANDNRAR